MEAAVRSQRFKYFFNNLVVVDVIGHSQDVFHTQRIIRVCRIPFLPGCGHRTFKLHAKVVKGNKAECKRIGVACLAGSVNEFCNEIFLCKLHLRLLYIYLFKLQGIAL